MRDGLCEGGECGRVYTPAHVGRVKIGADDNATIGRWRAASRLLSLRFATLLIRAGEGGCAKQLSTDSPDGWPKRSQRNGISQERQMSLCTVLSLLLPESQWQSCSTALMLCAGRWVAIMAKASWQSCVDSTARASVQAPCCIAAPRSR